MMSSFDTVIASLLKRMPSFRSSNHSIIASSLTSHIERGRLPQIQFLEKIIALVVDDDEGRKIHDLDAPDRFHAEFGIFDDFDFLDAVLGEICRRSSNRAEIEAAVLLAGLAHRDGAVALGDHHHRSARSVELVDEVINPLGGGWAEGSGSITVRRLSGTVLIDLKSSRISVRRLAAANSRQ